MKEIIILIGASKSGKTTYAKKVNYEYINIDEEFGYIGRTKEEKKNNFFLFLNRLANRLKKDENYVLDGYISYDKNFNYLRKKLKHKIKPIILFAKPEILQQRGCKQDIRLLYKEGIPNYWDMNECEFMDSSDGFRKSDYFEMMRLFLTKQDVINFLGRLKTKNYDKYYQTIELPFGMKIEGYNKNHEHKSWQKISEIYDFKNKKVADVGCFNGYFCFEARKLGAEVVGYDKCIPAIETAKEIAKLKGLKVRFKVFDIEKEDIPETYDLILFLNTSHHLNPKIAFNRIFKKAKAVIVEMKFSNITKEKVIEIAKENNHKLKKELISSRGRSIMLFEK